MTQAACGGRQNIIEDSEHSAFHESGSFSERLIAADVALVTGRNNAERVYRLEESAAYLQSATSWPR